MGKINHLCSLFGAGIRTHDLPIEHQSRHVSFEPGLPAILNCYSICNTFITHYKPDLISISHLA